MPLGALAETKNMLQQPSFVLVQDENGLHAQIGQQSIDFKLSDHEFWHKYSRLWHHIDELPFNTTPCPWQGEWLKFTTVEIEEIRQFQALNRLRLLEYYPEEPRSFSERCLKSGALRCFVLQKAGQKYGHYSEAAIQLTACFLGAQPQSIRTLIAVNRALKNH